MAFDGCGMMGSQENAAHFLGPAELGSAWVGMMSNTMSWMGFGLLSLIALFLVFWAAVDILKRPKMDVGARIGWLLVVLIGYFLPLSVLGAIVYAIWGRSK